jgi:hypothetical protein
MLPRASGFEACRDCGKLVVGSASAPVDPIRDAMEGGGMVAVDEEVPTHVEAEVGWRAWGVDPDTPEAEIPLLRSVTYAEAYWTPGAPMEATCGGASAQGDHVPGEHCSCGLYSAKTMEHLLSMGYHKYDADRAGLFHVIGEVSLWGKVVEGSQGWRAQFGYPRTLYVPYEAWPLAARLEAGYRVPVRLKNILNANAAKRQKGAAA